MLVLVKSGGLVYRERRAYQVAVADDFRFTTHEPRRRRCSLTIHPRGGSLGAVDLDGAGTVVLTGYNTDIDYAGTTYHVQTEDKGRSNPIVESLVYARGEILYSRRTSYQDLVDENVESKAIATLMERQHHTIVEAIRRGRLATLADEPALVSDEDDTSISRGDEDGGSLAEDATGGGDDEPTLDQVILDYLAAQRGRAHLVLKAVNRHDFVYGEEADISISAVDSQSTSPQVGAEITVLFKSTSEPRRLVLAEGETDEKGIFSAKAPLPEFSGGTSAVVITAESELGQSEIKHLVHK